jgi:hypothetical protein
MADTIHQPSTTHTLACVESRHVGGKKIRALYLIDGRVSITVTTAAPWPSPAPYLYQLGRRVAADLDLDRWHEEAAAARRRLKAAGNDGMLPAERGAAMRGAQDALHALALAKKIYAVAA